MKKSIFLTSLIVTLKAFAVIPSAEIVDINSTQKIIQAIVGYQLISNVSAIDVDEDISAILSIEFQYDAKIAIQQTEDLRAKYPGYTVQRVVPSNARGFEVKIEGLNVQVLPNVKQAIEGPYFIENVYLSKRQYSALITRQNSLVLNGTWSLQYQKTSIVDQFDLPRSVCKSLIRDGNELGKSLYVAYLFVLSPEMQKEIHDKSTFPVAVTTIIDSCFEVNNSLKGSVEQIMNQPMQLKGGDQSSIQILNEKTKNQVIDSALTMSSDIVASRR